LGVFDYFPTWGVSNIGGWGLGSLASNWLLTNYVNPYVSVNIGTQPAASTVVYDYSQPINVTAAAPDPSVAESTEQVFSAARDSFKAGDYQRALDLIDQVIKQTPNAPVVHEFRSLCLFALKHYDEAASVAYAVLSAGPCWSWSTLIGLYPDVDTYTNQLRALEAALRSNPNSTPERFLLAYHYLVQGHTDEAGREFANIAKVEPKDQLSASFAKALTKAKEMEAAETTTAVAGAQPSTTSGKPLVATSASVPNAPGAAAPPAGATSSTHPAEALEPPPPPADMAGTWKAAATPDTAVTLTLKADGEYTWNVANKGQQQQSITGRAFYVDDVMSLIQEDGPPLAGKIESKEANKFVFHIMGGGQKAPALTFTK
jgi:tetratricopeptide (TPR) repeat protein